MSNEQMEFEVKVLDIDVDQVRETLTNIGATMVHGPIKYTRVVYHFPSNQIRGYVRIRDENGTITMTIKTYSNAKFPEEYELKIDGSFEKAVQFLNALGLKQKAFHETCREKWVHPITHEIVIDWIPGIRPYIEIDCHTENNLNNMIELLNIDKSKIRYGAYDKTYNEYYGIDLQVINDETPMLTFSNIINEIKPTKNNDLLKEIYEKNKYIC